jgi:hypothetical protein
MTFVIFDYTGTVTVYTEHNAEFKEAQSSNKRLAEMIYYGKKPSSKKRINGVFTP